MNKIIKHILRGGGLILLVSACAPSEDEGIRLPGENEICFTSGIRAASRATATVFEDGEDISVFAFKDASGFAAESYASNRRYIYDKGRFVASCTEDAIVYPEDESPLAYQAIYPYQALAGASFFFEVKEDQSINNNYTLSDLMSASTVTTTDLVPHLIFSHRLSNIVVNLSFDEAPAGSVQVNFQNVTSTASVDMLTGTYKGIGEQTKTIRAASNGTHSYRVVLPPQSIEAGTALAVITTEAGDSYTLEMSKTTEWKSGIQYTYDLHIDKKGIVTFTAVIDPWGEPEEPINPGTQKRLVKITTQESGGTQTLDFSYDAQGRLASYTLPSIDDDVTPPFIETLQIKFSYTENGIISIVGLSTGEVYETVTYSLNTEGDISQAKVKSAAGEGIIDFSYENGYLVALTRQGNSNKINFIWNNGLLQNLTGAEEVNIEYDSNGNYQMPINWGMYMLVDVSDFWGLDFSTFFMSAALLNKIGAHTKSLPVKATSKTAMVQYQYQKDADGYITQISGSSVSDGITEEISANFYYE